MIHVVIASLKFGFEFHFEPREIDKVPAGELPTCIFSTWLMLKTHNEMHRIIAHFVRRDFWLEIERAKAAIARSISSQKSRRTKCAMMRCISLWVLSMSHVEKMHVGSSPAGTLSISRGSK